MKEFRVVIVFGGESWETYISLEDEGLSDEDWEGMKAQEKKAFLQEKAFRNLDLKQELHYFEVYT